MKKVVAIIFILICILSSVSVYATSTSTINDKTEIQSAQASDKEVNNMEIYNKTYGTENNRTTPNAINSKMESQLVQIKDRELRSIEDYNKAYGTESYGITAYMLNKVRIYSIPFCFIGIAVGAIYQYVIGIRKIDVRDKGFLLIIGFVTIFVICQVLPLIFAVVVKSWRV